MENDNIRKSYTALEDAFNQIIEITSLDIKAFIYLYLLNVDNLEHNNEFNSETVLKEIYDKYFYAYPAIDFGMTTYYIKKYGR